jgi:hypothetical protein
MRRIAAAVLVTACAASGPAQDPLQGLLPPKDGPLRAKVLVLKTGQVIQGEVESRLGGYMVQLPAGSMVVPYDQVRTAAQSLQDAYVRLRNDLRNPNANDHLDLARWCQRVGLAGPAREEVVAALQLEPDRADARALLMQLEQTAPAAPSAPAGDGIVSGTRLTSAAAMGGGRSDTPGGRISGERVAEYIRQIQPLLVNSCATAACHGGQNAGTFHLRAVGRITRPDSDANLATVLQFIDATVPDQSRLLTHPRQTNGPHATAFSGVKAREQLERLTLWVRLVARELQANGMPGDIVPVAGQQEPARVVPAAGVMEPMPGQPAPGAVPASLPAREAGVDDRFLRRILAEERPDAFDPNEFNRRVHGGVPATGGTPK